MKGFVLLLTLIISASLQAQEKEMFNITADINKDGIPDVVKVVNPRDPDKLQIRESDGYEYDFNQPVLSVYLGQADGTQKLWKRYDHCMPYSDDEFLFIDGLAVNVSEKGVITVEFGVFASAGSYSAPSYKYVFRYQNDDIYLIGEECSSLARNTGIQETTSINYLTHKKQTVLENAFDDKVPKKEKWTRIPVTPLRTLGSFQMGE